MKLDIGCGLKCRKGFVGVDKEKLDGVKYIFDFDKQDKLPFKDNSIQEIWCEHLIEHLDRPFYWIGEFQRVLKKGSKLTLIVPYAMNPETYVPIHKTFWNIRTDILFNGTYHETLPKWSNVKLFYEWFWWKEPLLKRILKKIAEHIFRKDPYFYERYFSVICPFAHIGWVLTK